MSIPFSQEKLRGEKRREVIKAIQKQIQAEALKAILEVFKAFLEGEVTSRLGRKKGEPRRVSSEMREIDWQCGNCGCNDANQFIRDGHYRRNLETGWGHIQNLQVPMLECQCCRHDVICDYTILEKCSRFWPRRWIKMSCGVPPVARVCGSEPSDGVPYLVAVSDYARLKKKGSNSCKKRGSSTMQRVHKKLGRL
jgi:hypothetical protein